MKFNVVFMGTPEIGAAILDSLSELNLNVIAVVSQPDKKVGRKQVLQYPPVKIKALEKGYQVLQPYNSQMLYDQLKDFEIDAIITCAYGMILPEKVLKLAKLKAINVHASLLPKYRGGAPIQYAIKNNDSETGITIMEMVKAMDAGDMFVQESIAIDFEDTTTSLTHKLTLLGQAMVKKYVLAILKGELKGQVQDPELVTFSPIITYEDERIDMRQSGLMIYNQIRSLLDEPGGHIFIDNQKVKIYDVSYEALVHKYPLNTIIDFNKEACMVALDGGILSIKVLQLPNKRKMQAEQIYHNLAKNWIGKVVE